MPYRRRTYTSKRKSYVPRKRTVRRKPVTARRPRRSRTYNVAPSGMPRTRNARLRYVQRVNFTPMLPMLSHAVFNANGPFKPDGASVSATHVDAHQPMGFDQWTSLFRNYVVKGSKITVVRIGTDADTTPLADQTGPGRFGIYVSDSETPIYTKGTSYKEARKGQVRYVSNNQRTAQSCQAYYSPRRVFGIKDIKDNQDRLGAEVTANPTELCSYILWAQLDEVPEGTVAWQFEVTIEYLIQFDEPVDLEQSTAASQLSRLTLI